MSAVLPHQAPMAATRDKEIACVLGGNGTCMLYQGPGKHPLKMDTRGTSILLTIADDLLLHFVAGGAVGLLIATRFIVASRRFLP